MNKYFYTSMYPIQFQDGYALAQEGAAGPAYEFDNQLKPTIQNLKGNKLNTAVSPEAPNTYIAKEIQTFMNHEKSKGRLAQKVRNITVGYQDEDLRTNSLE